MSKPYTYEQAIADYQNGLSLQQVAKKRGVEVPAVSAAFKRRNVNTRPAGRPRSK